MAFFRKIEDHVIITLDHGRLILAMIGGVLFVALIFLLGVLVGKTLWSMSAEASRASSQQIVHPVTPEPRVVGNPQYSFYEDVKKPANAEIVQENLKAPQPEETRAPTPVTPTVPAPLPLPPVAQPAPEPAPAPLVKPEQKTVKPMVSAVSTVAKPAPSPAPASRKGGDFCVGVESYQERGKAEAAQRVLAARGISTEVVPTTVKGTKWYRLQKGGFATREAAENYKNEVLKPKGFGGYVIAR